MNPSDLESFPLIKSLLMGDSSIENTTIYLCIARGNRILHTYSSSKDRRAELEAVAELCLESAPPYHSWYSHTAGARTVGFLMEDGYVFLAIVDPSLGSSSTLKLLESVRDGFNKAVKNGVHDELVPVVRSLIASLETISRPSAAAAAEEGPSSTKAPLLGRSCSRKDSVAEAGDSSERAVRIDVASEPAAAGCLMKSLSSNSMKVRGQQTGRRLWWRHVKIVIAADAVLCLVLFGAWLAVCRGFQCVSSRS